MLGDQLDRDSAVFDGFEPRYDRVWMAEVRVEATHVWSHKARIALFLAAMRHFREDLRERGVPVEYRELGAETHSSLGRLAGRCCASITFTDGCVCAQAS